jgi:DNA polymerase-1
MDKKKMLNLINDLDKNSESEVFNRYLLIDSLNLFFRNFSIINSVNKDGIHIGGVGGFLRSLGSLINKIQPTEIYVVFDGKNSSLNRRNLVSEYKGTRGEVIINKELYNDLTEQEESQVNQIIRIIQYLKLLPVKILVLDKAEADDIIAYLSMKLPKKDTDRVFMVTSDKDYLQLVNEQVILYRPIENVYYTPPLVKNKFLTTPENFIFYKILMGDSSDNVAKIKGLGDKKFQKLFPELLGETFTLDKLFKLCESKFKDNIIYARILHQRSQLEKSYKIMNLAEPMIDQQGKDYIDEIIKGPINEYHPDIFLQMYESDGIGGLIRNTEHWLKEKFEPLIK